MALAEIEKLSLVAMSYERDAILNALQKTGATEIASQSETEETVPLLLNCETLRAELALAEGALSALCTETQEYYKEHKLKTDTLKDGFPVSYAEFVSAKERKGEADALISEINALTDERRSLAAELSKEQRQLDGALLYEGLKEPLSEYADTRRACVRLGTLPFEEWEPLKRAAAEDELAECSLLASDRDEALVLLVYHRDDELAETLLQNVSFTPCAFSGGLSGEELCAAHRRRILEIDERLRGISKSLVEKSGQVRTLKIYCDYLGFELEKAELAEKMQATNATFLLTAYVPKDREERVSAALQGVSDAVWFEFAPVPEDEMPPTLYRNNKVVENFEFITDMYSPANAREFDPNTIMAFFYSLFLGFIMGDIGYGLFMLVGGGAIYLKLRSKDGGLKRLSGVFAIGGIFALIWGFLFNSFFGVPLPFLPTVMPNAQTDMWSFLGIKIPAVLVISLEIGVVQLFVGYLCRAVQCMRRGHFLDGMLDGFVWAAFSVGVGLAIVGLIDEANVSVLATVGGILAGATLLVAILTAGRKEKLLGKFTKGFGAAYGVINYASDILSYARLYGLMLSGAVIAQIISGYAVTGMNGGVGFLMSGNVGLVVLGIVLLIVGHGFNLAIGLLGAYIHDARLQYVEFYGRFYEGEGELFKPLGSSQKYIRLENEKLPQADLR